MSPFEVFSCGDFFCLIQFKIEKSSDILYTFRPALQRQRGVCNGMGFYARFNRGVLQVFFHTFRKFFFGFFKRLLFRALFAYQLIFRF